MAAGSSLQKMKVTHVLPSGDFAVANISTACRLAGFVTASNRWSSQAVAALSELIVNQPLKGAILGVVDNVTLVSLQSDCPVTISISQQLVEAGHGQFAPLPPFLSVGHETTAYVSHFDSPDNFWLQLEEAPFNDIAAKLEETFLDTSQTVPLTAAALYEGVLCVTQFKEDGALYRARILSASDTEVKVLFVDYGNTQVCQPVELYPIPASLAQEPGQAIHCSLATAVQSEPVSWSEAALQKFAEVVQDIPLSVRFEAMQKRTTHGELKWAVSLFDVESGTSIASAVIGGGGSAHVGGSDHTLPLLDVPVNTPVDVLISYIESSEVIWLQLSKKYESLVAMMAKLADHCSSIDRLSSGPDTAEVQSGSLCAAQFSEDGVWYRAKVVQTKPNVVVRYIDYGNTEAKKSPTEVFALPLQFTTLPAQAVPCSLANYSPSRLDAVSAASRLEKYLDRQLVASFLTAPQVGKERCSVRLFDTVGDEDHDIGKILSEEDSGPQNLEIKPEALPSSVTPAYVTTVVSPSQIYIQLAKSELELASLLDDMYAYYTTSKVLPLATVHQGAICAAPYSVDGSWYRVKVVSVKPDTASVFFIDYGNSEEVSCSQLMPLTPEFFSLPTQAIPCALFVGVGAGVTWTSTAVNIITSYTADKEVLVTPTGEMEGNSPLVRITIGRQDLGEELMKEGVAKLQHSVVKDSRRRQVAVPFPVLRPGSIHKCIVLEWKSEQSFSCQFSDSVSDLETLSNNIYSLYSSAEAPPKVASAQPGDFACCQFTEDDSWYRARVMSKCGSIVGNFEVLYLDYGNREMLHVSRMRELVDQVCQLPAQSIECFAAMVPRGVSPSDEELSVKIVQQTGERSYSVEIVQQGGENRNVLPGLGDQGEVDLSFAVDNIEVNSFIDVQVTHIVSPNLFYCIDPQATRKLEDLLHQLTEEVPSLHPCSLPIVGQACVAMFSQDDSPYRARIMSIDHSQLSAKVFFVDYGNSDVIPFSRIYSLPDKFLNTFPCQAIPCCLDCTSEPSDGWTEAATAAFEDLVLEEVFVAEIREKKQEQGESIVVVELLDGDVLVRKRFEGALSMSTERSGKAESSAALSLLPYPPLEIDTCKPFQAVVTHIVNPSSFYVQPSSVEETLVGINEYIDALLMGGKTSEIPVRDLREGAPCLAKYSVDHQWYRGVIEGRSTQKWKVHFVDFGNTEEICSQSDLTRLSPELLASPVLAIHCGLQGIVPSLGSKGWSRHTVSAFKEILLDKEVSITITSTTKDAHHLVLLRMDNGEDVGDCLVRSGFTSRSDADNVSSSTQTSQGPSDDLYLSTASSHLDSNSSAQPSSQHSSDAGGDVAVVTKTPPTSFTYPITPEVNTRLQVMVVFATSPNNFFCQDSETSHRLDEVMEKLAQYCPTAPLISSVAVGQPCAALYPADGCWYRAEVMEVTGSQALVQFVDYGNSEVIDVSSIVALQSDLVSLPVQAFWCSLSDDFEKQYSRSEAAAFVAVVTEQSFELVVRDIVGDSLIVSLLDSSGVAVSDDCCKREQDGQDTKATPLSSSATLAPVEAHHGSLTYTPLKAGAKLSVVVTFVNSPADFFCQDTSNSDALNEVMALLETHCADCNLASGDAWAVGDVCATLYSVDGGWYRAEVTDVTSDRHVTVQYVDYGNIETVEPTALRPLTSEHLTLPAQAIWCSVTDDFELQFSDEHIEAFKTAISDQHCSLAVRSCKGDSVIVELRDPTGQVFDDSYFQDNASLGHEGSLVGQMTAHVLPLGENAPVSPLYFTYQPPLAGGRRLQVLVTHVTSPVDFFCQDLTRSERLGQLMDSLAAHCHKTVKPVPFAPSVGEACAAVFSEDGQWYRAAVVESGDDPSGKTLVQFVDYGNMELVDSAQIHPLQPEHVVLEAQAIWCSITTDFTKTYSQSEKASFSAAVENEIFDMVADLLEGDSVVVKLFNSSGQQVFPTDKEEEVPGAQFGSNANELPLTAAKTSPNDSPPIPVNKEMVYEKLPRFNVGDKVEVYVTYVVSPADFHCQLCTNEEQLDILMAELADHCNSLPPEGNTRLTEGQVCAAASSMDDAWYRAEVTQVGKDKAVVFFVDYGNSEEVPLRKVRPLLPRHVRLPAQAVWCSLTPDFSCEFETNVCIDFDREATENMYTMEVLQVEADCLVVRLLDDSGSAAFCNFIKDQSLSQGSAKLQEAKGHASDTPQDEADDGNLPGGTGSGNLPGETQSGNPPRETGSGHLQVETGNCDLPGETGSGDLQDETGSGNQLLKDESDESSEAEVGSPLSYKPVSMPSVGVRLPIQVTHVSSPTDFYCQVLDSVDEVEAVQALLATHEDPFESKITESSLNQPCAALDSGTGVWCRAVITDINNESTVLVHFVDWGNSEEVPVTNLKHLAEEHLILPPQALWCSVTSNFEQQFGEDEVGDFVTVVKNQVFELEIRKVAEETAVVTLWDEEGTEVGRMFSDRRSRESSEELDRLAEEFGKEEETSTTFKWPLKVGIGDKVNVYISSIDSASSFFCQPLHMAAELDDIMAKMADMLVENGQPMEKSRVEEGVICAGCFSQDDSWYRAVIEKVISSDQVLLRYIDYGNQDVVPMERLAELPSQLLSCRAQLIHCSCVPSEVGSTKKMDEAFKEIVSKGMQVVVAVVKEISRGRYLVKLHDESDVELDLSAVLKLGRAEESIEEEESDSGATSENDAEVDRLTKGLAQDKGLRIFSKDEEDEEDEEEFEDAKDEFQSTIASIPSPPNREKLSLFDKDDSTDSEETSSSTEGPMSPLIMPFKLSLGVKELLQVEVVTVDNPSIIYVQRCDCAAELKTLNSDIEQYTSTTIGTEVAEEGAFYPPSAPPKKGDFVLAKFSSDTTWVRAEVIGEYNPTINACQLFSVDFGNSEDVPLQSILFCPKSFLMLPQQAILCCLADVPRRDSWPVEYQNTILSFVSGKVLQAEVVLPSTDGERAVIRLTDMETGSDLSQEIVSQLEEECGDGESTGSSPEHKQRKEVMSHEQEKEPSLEQPGVVEDILAPANELSLPEQTTVSGSDQIPPPPQQQEPPPPQEQEPPPPQQQLTATAEQGVGAPQEVTSTSLKLEVTAPHQQSVNVPLEKKGDAPQCEVSTEIEQEVISLCENIGATVEQEDATTQVKEGVTPPEQEAAPVEQEDAPVEQEAAPVEQEDAPVEQEDAPVGQEDVTPPEQEAATQSPEQEECDDQGSVSADEDDEEPDREPIGYDPSEYCVSIPSSPALEVGSETEVLLSHVNSPHSFFCHQASRQASLERFMEDLNTFYNDLYYFDFKFTDEPEEGDAVCCQSGEDELWYRGEVVSVYYSDVEEPTARVLFVDYGGSEVVQLTELCRLAKDFGEEVPFVIECSMVGVTSKGSDGDCIDYLESYFDVPLKIKVVEPLADRVTPVVLSTSDNRSLNQAVINAGIALATSDGQFTNPLAPPTGATPSSASPSKENINSTGAFADDNHKVESVDVKDLVEEGDVDQTLHEGGEQEAVPERLQGAAPEASGKSVDEQIIPTVELKGDIPVIIARVDPDDVRQEVADDKTDESDKAAAVAGTGESETLHQSDSLMVARQPSDATTDSRAEGLQKDSTSVSPSWEVIGTCSSLDTSIVPSGLKGVTQPAAHSAVSPEGSWEVVSSEHLSAHVPSSASAEDSKDAFEFPPVVPTAKKTSPLPKPLGRGFRDEHRVGVAKVQQPCGLSKSLQSSPKKSPQFSAAPISLGSSPQHLAHTGMPQQPPAPHSMVSSYIESLTLSHTEQDGAGYSGFSPPLTTPPTDISHTSGTDMSLTQCSPLIFNQGDKLKLVFTGADSPEQFTCHLIGSTQLLQTQVDVVQGGQELAGGERGEEMAPGLVQSSFDGQWYRGDILKQGGTETTDAGASVGTMDSGSIQQMPTSAAHPLPEHFTAGSHHTVPCSLAYIEPAEAAVGWSEEAVKDFISIMTTAESFQAVVVSMRSGGQVCIQAEVGNGNEDVADKLVAMGHASPRLPKV